MTLVLVLLSVGILANDVIMLPPLTMETLDGGTITDVDLQGPAVLCFTIADCEMCDEGLALLQAAAADYPGVSFYLVTPGGGVAVEDLVADKNIEWPVLLDETFLLASVLAVGRVPLVVTIRDGLTVGRAERGFTDEELRAVLDELVAPPDPNAEPVAAPGSMIYAGFLRLSEPMLTAFVGAECPVCHRMLPQLHAIAEAFPVTLVITEELTEPELFASDATRLTIALDPQWRIADLFEVMTVPTLFLWNEDGTLEWAHTGYVENLANVIETFTARLGSPSDSPKVDPADSE